MPAEKTVVIIGPAHPLRGGLATYNERLAKEFIDLGYKAIIYTFSLQYPSFLFPGKTQYSTEAAPLNLEIRVKINSVDPLNWLRTGREIKKLRPDLVVIKFWIPFMGPCLGTLAKIIRSNRHSKVISIIDNIIPHEKRPGDRLLAGYFARNVDGFIAQSKSVLTDLETFNTKRPMVFCPHPLFDNFGEAIDKVTAKQTLGLEEKTRYVLFFGFIRDYKGLDLLLEAFGTQEVKDSGLKLIVAGEFYTDPEPYHTLIRKLKLEDQVVLRTDFIPDSAVYKYFCASDLVVQPYKNATQSGVTQIAYHFNKPMITTNVGGLAEIVPDGKVGFVVDPDPVRIADAILRFYTGDHEQAFIANILEEKRRYSWRHMVEAVEQVSVTHS